MIWAACLLAYGRMLRGMFRFQHFIRYPVQRALKGIWVASAKSLAGDSENTKDAYGREKETKADTALRISPLACGEDQNTEPEPDSERNTLQSVTPIVLTAPIDIPSSCQSTYSCAIDVNRSAESATKSKTCTRRFAGGL
ncbi:hypothetical protein VOLCADRAFT_98493 [Volvox carteri f. nagariensis]|uniref:Uncharacterized protein n=1 Tax=Volvox carteri f. nagariensis TaxID=3068 RepID=D8UFH4_VOLCA|nr:uncharacterized protein VOLCADRAFT_98493 [Volvox carteri f. nagariensis]EFJ41502.1 hypothetical protein VOLCADRAFT_98493 [Volvox carteri f. nagariensis]|eukprot:XP_002957447.1 hypothetical protein VOLCADRAFT_98493 [Volvox carteri f. nagariensis]